MRISYLLLLPIMFFITACGGAASSASATPEPLAACQADNGNAERGQALFEQDVLTYYAGCITCHMAENDIVLQGPSLKGVATIADSRVTGQDAETYLCKSILAPNAHVVDAFSANLMPPYYANWLTQQELDDLVAYLLTLE